MVLVKKWILSKPFEGDAKKDNFELVQEETEPSLEDGDVFVEAEYISVDPYMRLFANKVGEVVTGGNSQVARVLKSKHSKFPVGCEVIGPMGWRTHTLVKDTGKLCTLPEHGDLPSSVALGVLGMPGATAYCGFHHCLNAKSGETVVVSTASGAVGSIVGQIAKMKGCTVIGFAGSKDKCEWLKKDLKLDEAFNYKEIDVDTALSRAAPDGVDCYWDNVGGEFTSKVVGHMRKNGRIVICGVITNYSNDGKLQSGPLPYQSCLAKTLRIEGFQVYDHLEKWPEAFADNYSWIKEGKLLYKETVTDGFDHLIGAFIGLFRGANFGKAIVKV